MLSRSLKRALLDSRWPLPPPFLLPWAASLTTVSHGLEAVTAPPPMPRSRPSHDSTQEPTQTLSTATQRLSQTPSSLSAPIVPNKTRPSKKALSEPLRAMLPLLASQTPHYITIHLHGRPYLVTAGDTVRLPFLMHGVEPGDVLRLDRAVNLGSRDYTLKASRVDGQRLRSVIDPRKRPEDKIAEESMVSSLGETSGQVKEKAVLPAPRAPAGVPHFIPNIAVGKHSYLDPRLFVCRAVVMGVESEPLRIKEKTKRRQRKVKMVKSKHRFTILRVKEVTVRSVEEIEGGV